MIDIVRTPEESPRARLTRTIKELIADGTFEGGVPLPPERELCRMINANQRTLQKALSILEDEKIIFRKSPKIRVVTSRSTAQSEMLKDTIITITSRLPSKSETGGFSHLIINGVANEIAGKGLNLFTFNPEKSISEISRFIAKNPKE